jgi:hypothetical protein
MHRRLPAILVADGGYQVTTFRQSAAPTTTKTQATTDGGKDGTQWP